MKRTSAVITMTLMLSLLLLLFGCGGVGTQSDETAAEDAAAESLVLLEVNGETLEVELEDNKAAHALREMIGESGMELELEEYGGFEKVGPLPGELPASDEQMDVSPGDIVLYQGDQISLFYGENSWSYTRLGHVKDANGAQLQEILGDGDIHVKWIIKEK